MPRSPCSGRGLSGSVVSHLGPPIAASNTASAARAASSVSAGRGSPVSSMAMPPSKRLDVREPRVEAGAQGVEDLHGLRGDLRADTVARQQAYVVRLAHVTSSKMVVGTV